MVKFLDLIGIRNSGYRVRLGIEWDDDCVRIRLGMEAFFGSYVALQMSSAIILHRDARLNELTALVRGKVHSCRFAIPWTNLISDAINDPCKRVSNETIAISTAGMNSIVAAVVHVRRKEVSLCTVRNGGEVVQD